MARFLKATPMRSYFWAMKIGGILLLFFLVIGIGAQRQTAKSHGFKPYVSFVHAQTVDPNGSGFLWTDTAGWISMNCLNDWDNDGRLTVSDNICGTAGAYGVTMEFVSGTGEGTLSGYGWSPNVGFVCFGRTCGGCSAISCEGGLPGTAVQAKFDVDEAREISGVGPDGRTVLTRRVAFIHGFARILAYANEGGINQGGWIALGGRGDGTNPSDGGVAAYLTSSVGGTALTLAGSAWQQNPDRTGFGWFYFGDSPPGNSPCTDATCRTGCNPGDSRCDVTFPPARETECNNSEYPNCCANGIDDDHDKNYALDSIHNPGLWIDDASTTGVDCLDYDCVGQRFYSTTYNPDPTRNPINAATHCGEISTHGNSENAFPEDCFDGFDNDLDAYVWNDSARLLEENSNADAGVDCGDADCVGAVFGGQQCTQEELYEDVYNGCYDGFDNDGNGLIDCADPDCNNLTGFVLCSARARNCLCAGHERAAGLGLAACTSVQDPDGDNVRTAGTDGSACDNCPINTNVGQQDTDADGVQVTAGDRHGGDACDPISWLETQEGSLYAGRLSGTPPPLGANTATYCILTAGNNATEVSTRFPGSLCGGLPVTALRLALAQNNQTLTLLSGTANPVRGQISLQQFRPRPNSGVVDLNSLENIDEVLRTLNARRFYYHGDLTVNTAIEFTGDKGGATIFVEGNLLFGPNGHLSYAQGNSRNLSNLTSIAWIVTGDIVIDPNVADLEGTFLSTGRISTGTRTPAEDNSLTIRGLVIARKFKFERQYASLDRGSELIIYDGRAVLNPPPGLSDLVKALPTFRSVAPH